MKKPQVLTELYIIEQWGADDHEAGPPTGWRYYMESTDLNDLYDNFLDSFINKTDVSREEFYLRCDQKLENGRKVAMFVMNFTFTLEQIKETDKEKILLPTFFISVSERMYRLRYEQSVSSFRSIYSRFEESAKYA